MGVTGEDVDPRTEALRLGSAVTDLKPWPLNCMTHTNDTTL